MPLPFVVAVRRSWMQSIHEEGPDSVYPARLFEVRPPERHVKGRAG